MCRYDQIALQSKDWILYTKLSNIKKYIKLHFPNKYWSIFISMPSSWDTFRSTDIFIYHRYLLLSTSILSSAFHFTHPFIFSPLLWRPNNFVMLHLLQPSTYEIIPHHMTCSLIRAKTYIVNRFLSPHQCSIIQDMRPCFRCKCNKRCYSGIRRQALTAAATVFTVTDLNVRLCCEVIICEINACALLRWHTVKEMCTTVSLTCRQRFV